MYKTLGESSAGAVWRETGHGQEQTQAVMDKQWGRWQAGVAKPEPVLLPCSTDGKLRLSERGRLDTASLMERNLLKECRGVFSRQGLKE